MSKPITQMGRAELVIELQDTRARVLQMEQELNQARADAERWAARVKLLEGRLDVIQGVARGG